MGTFLNKSGRLKKGMGEITRKEGRADCKLRL